jgi:hypothetical protein
MGAAIASPCVVVAIRVFAPGTDPIDFTASLVEKHRFGQCIAEKQFWAGFETYSSAANIAALHAVLPENTAMKSQRIG